MKKSIIVIFMMILGITLKSQDTVGTKVNYPVNVYGEISVLIWDNQVISDAYGNMPLFGAGIEKKLSEDFKFGAGFNLGSSTDEDCKLNYSQLKAYLEYSWYAFGSNRPNVVGGFGGKRIHLKESWDSDSESGNTLGFFLKIGVEIPMGKNNFLGFGWNSTYASMEYAQENINVGSIDFYGKLIIGF